MHKPILIAPLYRTKIISNNILQSINSSKYKLIPPKSYIIPSLSYKETSIFDDTSYINKNNEL